MAASTGCATNCWRDFPPRQPCRARSGNATHGRGSAWRASHSLAFLFLALAAGSIPARATIRYEISLAHPAQHQFHVAMTIPDVRQRVVVQIPAWNTLYQIRDFGYRVVDLHATDAQESR